VIILDTNVLSEAVKPVPAEQVLRWLGARPAGELFTTAITQAEMLYGLEVLPDGERRRALAEAIGQIFIEGFRARILPFDSNAAAMFAKIVASRRAMGRPIGQTDAQIAAIARSHGAVVATRNTSDFEDCAVRVADPWGEA
jgi:predicted nucleic acid-binding protein